MEKLQEILQTTGFFVEPKEGYTKDGKLLCTDLNPEKALFIAAGVI